MFSRRGPGAIASFSRVSKKKTAQAPNFPPVIPYRGKCPWYAVEAPEALAVACGAVAAAMHESKVAQLVCTALRPRNDGIERHPNWIAMLSFDSSSRGKRWLQSAHKPRSNKARAAPCCARRATPGPPPSLHGSSSAGCGVRRSLLRCPKPTGLGTAGPSLWAKNHLKGGVTPAGARHRISEMTASTEKTIATGLASLSALMHR